MAALVTISTFSGLAPPWSLTQLDTDLTGLRDAIQSQNTFSNFAVDTGAANAYVTTPAVGITASLTAGLLLQFKAINANTGASTLNHGGLGVKNIVNIDGSALVANQIPLNGIVQVVYDGTQFFLANTSPVLPYTTGTWTPSLGGTTSYTVQVGTWTKIGRLVFFNCILTINLIGTGSTTIVSGLPFVPENVTFAVISVEAASATAIVSANAQINTNQTITITSRTVASVNTAANAIFGNNTAVRISGCFQV